MKANRKTSYLLPWLAFLILDWVGFARVGDSDITGGADERAVLVFGARYRRAAGEVRQLPEQRGVRPQPTDLPAQQPWREPRVAPEESRAEAADKVNLALSVGDEDGVAAVASRVVAIIRTRRRTGRRVSAARRSTLRPTGTNRREDDGDAFHWHLLGGENWVR